MKLNAQIVQAIAVMIEGYGRAATEAQLEAYKIALAGLPEDAVRAAVVRAIREPRQHPPTPGEIREQAISGGDASSRANAAWAVYEQAQGMVGAEYGICFADGLINATVRSLGGWRACCNVPDKEFHTWHKRAWMSEYQRYAREGASPDLTRAIGSCLPRTFQGETLKMIGCAYEPLEQGWLPRPPQNLLNQFAKEAQNG